MGIGPATIKSKSELVQPSKRIGYLYNVEPSRLFPMEQAHSSSAVGPLGFGRLLEAIVCPSGRHKLREPWR